ncbi:MAG TPA: disulfide oxidoreductase [Herpetosiphonaceae bacterium]
MNQHTLNRNTTLDEYDAGSETSQDRDLVDWLGVASRHIALLAAWIATCGSLFFSEVLGWVPCVLCWYQRILMYPLAILLAIGIVRRDRRLYIYVLPFSITGMIVALYHHLLVKTDWLPAPACVSGVPCTVDYLNLFGLITIPWLAFTAFTIITGMMATYAWLQPRTVEEADEESEDQAAPARFHFDNATLAAGMIIVGVVLVFLVGSTFV